MCYIHQWICFAEGHSQQLSIYTTASRRAYGANAYKMVQTRFLTASPREDTALNITECRFSAGAGFVWCFMNRTGNVGTQARHVFVQLMPTTRVCTVKKRHLQI